MRTSIARRSTTTNTGLEPRGYLHITNGFASRHRSIIDAVLRAEEHRAQRITPTARILGFDSDGSGGLLVSTNTEHLAHRLGRALETTLGGELHHGFFRDNKLALVWWRSRSGRSQR